MLFVIAVAIITAQLFGNILHAQQRWFTKASWIAAGPDSDDSVSSSKSAALPLFRKSFVLPASPVSAVLRISGLGQYEAHIDGHDVTSTVLTPGWTVYSRHVLFDTYDVTRLLSPGAHAIGVMLGIGSLVRAFSLDSHTGLMRIANDLEFKYDCKSGAVGHVHPEEYYGGAEKAFGEKYEYAKCGG